MTLLPLCLVLTSGLCHALWNVAAKRAGDAGTAFVWLYSAVAVCVYTLPMVWLAVTGRIHLNLVTAGAVAVSAVGQLSYYVLLQKAYSIGDLSVVYPVARGSGPLLLVSAAIILLGERPGSVALLGAAAVVIGVIVVGTARLKPAADSEPRRLGMGADVGFGLAAGALIAACNLWDARTVSVLAVSPILLEWVFNTTRVVVLAPTVTGRGPIISRLWREHRFHAIAVGVLMPLSYMLALWAFTLAPISVTAPVREVSIVAACLFGWLLLKEPQPARRMFGAAVVLAGVFALALGS
ncbi:MAG TPA: EamA family transporter [Mycobacteriales bacterium]|nr:EamA family transporter [Mycobacteriales bacterium]